MKRLIEHWSAFLSALLPFRLALAGCSAPGIAQPRAARVEHAPWRRPDAVANSGGPRSREVSTPLVSRLLSGGSMLLGFKPLDLYEMSPRCVPAAFREIALRLLAEAGFRSTEEAWAKLRDQLPDRPALVIDVPGDGASDTAGKPDRCPLIAALVLGRCCGSHFSPERPIIWSERRLARRLRLVHLDSETFTCDDDE